MSPLPKPDVESINGVEPFGINVQMSTFGGFGVVTAAGEETTSVSSQSSTSVAPSITTARPTTKDPSPIVLSATSSSSSSPFTSSAIFATVNLIPIGSRVAYQADSRDPTPSPNTDPEQLRRLLVIAIPPALTILLLAATATWAVVWYKERQRRQRRMREKIEAFEDGTQASSKIPSRLWRGTGWTISAPSEPSFGTLTIAPRGWKRDTIL